MGQTAGRIISIPTVVGELTVSYTARGLYRLELPGFAGSNYPPVSAEEPAWLQKLARDLQNYFLGQPVHFTCPWMMQTTRLFPACFTRGC